MSLNRPITGINKYPFRIPIQGICIPPANIFVANNTIYINENINISSIPYCLYTGMSTIQINSGYTLTVDINFILPSNITTISGSGTLSINSGYTLTIGANSTFTVSTVSGAGTLSISSGYTLTFSGSNLLPSTLTATGTLALSGNYTLVTNITNGTGNLVINSGYTLTVSSNITLGFTSVGGSGTLSISSGYTLTLGANTTFSVSTVSGSGTLSLNSYTLSLGANITFAVSTVSNGTIAFNSHTLTINVNTTFSVGALSGDGTISISSGYTLTVSANIYQENVVSQLTITGAGTLSIASGVTYNVSAAALDLSVATVSGSGTIAIGWSWACNITGNVTISGITIANSGAGSSSFNINSGCTLTQSGAITLSGGSYGLSVNLSGTWANAGYGITISGAPVTFSVSGSITTASTAGTMTVDGTVYWHGSGITAQTSNAVPTFPLSLAGTSIFVGSPTGTTGTATTSISLSSTAINANAGDGSASGSGKIPYIHLTSVTGSATGKYGLGVYDSTAGTYAIFGLIYVGGTSAFSVSVNVNYTTADTSGDTIEVFNASGSAGTLTLSGTAYV